jgi:hypothetical protein
MLAQVPGRVFAISGGVTLVSNRLNSHHAARPDSAYPAYLCGIWEGDRRDSNPRPSEPQSADTCFYALLYVAELAYLSRFLC